MAIRRVSPQVQSLVNKAMSTKRRGRPPGSKNKPKTDPTQILSKKIAKETVKKLQKAVAGEIFEQAKEQLEKPAEISQPEKSDYMKGRRGRKPKHVIKQERVESSVPNFDLMKQCVEGIMWAFLRSSAHRSQELFEHELSYLQWIKIHLDENIRCNGATAVCDILKMQLSKLIDSMIAGGVPHLSIEPYFAPNEVTPKGFIKVEGKKYLGFVPQYSRAGNHLAKECKECLKGKKKIIIKSEEKKHNLLKSII